ncbi:helix-turn-helix domain-containing protein [Niabella beijingensis]|uniref:helix-turn-helix domain-containing protein n=1 Tax=Niabella beijingensis TaxID=2872700 RepID=UPI001CBA6F18|nr:helix-turn-helix transcriptional regulator [Niabella beijingensis]MBZ4190568.1 helix-turn-helix domain-containing protein [Niabella beijingensis]
MSEERKNNSTESIRLKELRIKLRISLNALYKITGVSTATLASIQKGSINYNNATLTTLSQAFGIEKNLFYDLTVAAPSREKLISALKKYVKQIGVDIDVKSLVSKSMTSFILTDYIDMGFLNTYKSTGQIIKEIAAEYNVQLKSPQTSKILLTKAADNNGVLEKRSGIKANTNEYRRKR